MRKILLGAAALGLIVTADAKAQTASEQASYAALHGTPIGALAPVAPNLGRQTTAWRAHYGRHDMMGGTNTFAIGADFPAGMQTSFGLTFGWRNVSNADDHFMVGTQLAGNLMGGTPPGTIEPEAARLALSYKGELGYGRHGDADLLGAAVSLPVSVPVASGQTRFVPFLSPGLGWGRLSANGDGQSDLRFMLGGGLGLEVAGGTGVHVGARRVFVDGADTQYGVGVTLRPR